MGKILKQVGRPAKLRKKPLNRNGLGYSFCVGTHASETVQEAVDQSLLGLQDRGQDLFLPILGHLVERCEAKTRPLQTLHLGFALRHLEKIKTV